MQSCGTCGKQVPPHLKHLPSRSTDGAEFGGEAPCLIVAVDRHGRTSREAAEWVRLKRAGQREVRDPA